MADIIFGGLGAAVGSFFGQWQAGFSIGSMLGGLLFPQSPGEIESNRSDINIQGAGYGNAIPKVYGTDRMAGNLIWGMPVREVASTTSGGKNQPSIKNYSYFASFAIMVCEGPIEKINKIYANGKVIYDATDDTGYVRNSPVEDHGDNAFWASYLNEDNVRIYLGDSDQGRDALIIADKGITNTPAYRNRVIVVFEDLPLEPFGRAVPNIEFEVKQSDNGTVNLEEMMDDISEKINIGSDKRDFSALSGIVFDGVTVSTRTEARSVIEQAQKAFFFDVIENEGLISASLCLSAPTLEFDSDFLGAGINTPLEKQHELTRGNEPDIPRQINVTYRSKAFNHQSFTQNSVRVQELVDEPESLVLPFVLAEMVAKKVAIISLFAKLLGRDSYVLEYPFVGLKYSPGDFININLENVGLIKLKIIENYLDFFGTIRSLAIRSDQSIYDQEVDPTEVDYPVGVDESSSVAAFEVIDSAALTDALSDTPTLMFAGAGPGMPWKGGQVHVSPPMHFITSYNYTGIVATFGWKSWTGIVTSPLPINDPSNTTQEIEIFITLTNGELNSCTRSDLLNGKNVAYWGNEIIQFMTATKLSDTEWMITDILRARRGTEWAMDHSTDERFVLIDDASLELFQYQESEHNSSRTFTMYESEVDYTHRTPIEHTIVIQSNSAKAYSPCKGVISRDGFDNATITWVRRDRKGQGWLDFKEAPMSEPDEEYRVEIYDADYENLIRTIDVSVESASYTAAQQTTDFGSTQSTIWAKIYQLQADTPWGKGFPLEIQD